MRFYTAIFVTVISLLISIPVFAKSQSPFKAWKSKKHVNHKLTGKIWSTADKTFITKQELIARLAIRDYILLGEIHDNPDHHRLQAWVISRVVRFDRKPAIVMEMIDRSQNDIIKSFYDDIKAKKQKKPAEQLGEALNWKKRGWPDWKIYKPIASTLFANRLLLSGARPDKQDIFKVRKKGLKTLGQEKLKKLALNENLDTVLLNDLKNELNKSHCNMLPFSALGAMANMQRFVDATMTDSLIEAGNNKGAILIAGSGHIRTDRAIPYYLNKRLPKASVITLSLTEVIENETDVDKYIPKDPSTKPAMDYIWFTPAQEREDQCELFKKHMQKKKTHKTQSKTSSDVYKDKK